MNIKDILLLNPLIFENNLEIVNKVALNMLPYFTGIEIECDNNSNYDNNNFIIEGILENFSTSNEKRFKLDIGLVGFKALFYLCEKLKKNCIPNSLSGIHYHIDLNYDYEIAIENIYHYKEYILKELESWNYTGNYNKKDITQTRTWVRLCNQYKTIEYRIGEMSFNYKLLIKRITHCQALTRYIREKLYIKDFKTFNRIIEL